MYNKTILNQSIDAKTRITWIGMVIYLEEIADLAVVVGERMCAAAIE